MSRGEVVTLFITLMTIGAAIVGALIRTIFSGTRIRIDRLEEKLDRCMEEIIKLARSSRD